MNEISIIRNAQVLSPEDLGSQDVLIAGRKVVALGPDLDVGGLAVEEVDGTDRTVVPGLVDGHLHTIGGGGNEGYASRIPELWAGELATAGLTTVVAPPGLDMVTKNLETILAKAYALESEGISAYMMVGGFQRPFPTLTRSIVRDIFTVEKVLGVKIALGEARATRFLDHELLELAAQLHWLAGATGKACLLHAHLGGAERPADQLLRTMEAAGVPRDRYMATHCNYTSDTMAAALEISNRGGYVDFNPVLDPSFGHPQATPVAEAVIQCLDAGVPIERMTITTDGNASVPILMEDGTRGTYEKSLTWLWDNIVALVTQQGLSLSTALALVTTNPARAFGLQDRKGQVRVGADADLLLVGPDLAIDRVWASGRQLVRDGEPLAMSMYEPGRPARSSVAPTSGLVA